MSDLFQDEESEEHRTNVQLLDEDGNPHTFIVVEALEIDENQYLLLTPVLEEDLELVNLYAGFSGGRVTLPFDSKRMNTGKIFSSRFGIKENSKIFSPNSTRISFDRSSDLSSFR